MKKIFILNFNGVLNDVLAHYYGTGQLTDNYWDADVVLTWQDVRGDIKEFCQKMQGLGKPVVVYQHGRGATRDYGPPNSFPLLADKILVWGEVERMRLMKYGVSADKIEVVGCTLFSSLKPKAKDRPGTNILFAPVISTKEEPENLKVFAALKIWESERLMEWIDFNYAKLKDSWAYQENKMMDVALPDGTTERRNFSSEVHPSLPRYITYGSGLVNVKITGVHDGPQYMAPTAISNPGDPNHLQATAEILANTDVLVCLEEGTMQMLACALDIPVILVDIFRYGTYAGMRDYDRVEKIRTNAVYTVKDLKRLGPLINHALKNRSELRKNRITICEQEGGAHLGSAKDNIIRAMDRYLNAPQLVSP